MKVTKAKIKSLKDRRFECQKCGICCSHKGLIGPSEENIKELAKYLQISELSFAIRYLQEIYDPKLDAYIMAFKTNNPHDPMNGCIFHFGRFCAIYNSCRADLCNAFPWNYFNLVKEEWDPRLVNDNGTFWCKGVGKGREWSIEEIRQMEEKYKNTGFGFRRHLSSGDDLSRSE